MEIAQAGESAAKVDDGEHNECRLEGEGDGSIINGL